FFQAEDGIRDFHVTGVQTCALPIYKEYLAQVGYNEFPATYEEFIEMIKKLKEAGITPISLGNKEKWPLQSSYMSIIGQRFAGERSEERRVGKECRGGRAK